MYDISKTLLKFQATMFTNLKSSFESVESAYQKILNLRFADSTLSKLLCKLAKIGASTYMYNFS